MKAKKKDKMLFQEKFPELNILFETDTSTNINNLYMSGSLFATFYDLIFIYCKKNFVYKIPWRDIISLDKKTTFLSSKIVLTYGNNRKLNFSFTSSDPVNAIDLYYKTIKLEDSLNSNIINELKKENKNLRNENQELKSYINELNKEEKAVIEKEHNKKTKFKVLYEPPKESTENYKTPLNLTYTKARSLTNSFVVIDFETTGLKYNVNEIIQCGIVEYKEGQIVNEYSEYFRPNKTVSAKIKQLTGITNEFLEDKPKLGYGKLELIYKLIKGKTIVAHNAPFDMKFLLYQFYIHGIQHEKFRVIDTLTFSRRLINETPNHKLQTLKDYFKLDDGDSHNAINDCRATGELLLLLLSRQNKS